MMHLGGSRSQKLAYCVVPVQNTITSMRMVLRHGLVWLRMAAWRDGLVPGDSTMSSTWLQDPSIEKTNAMRNIRLPREFGIKPVSARLLHDTPICAYGLFCLSWVTCMAYHGHLHRRGHQSILAKSRGEQNPAKGQYSVKSWYAQ